MNNAHNFILSLQRAKIELSRKVSSTANDLGVDAKQRVQDIENIDKVVAVIKSFDAAFKVFESDSQFS